MGVRETGWGGPMSSCLTVRRSWSVSIPVLVTVKPGASAARLRALGKVRDVRRKTLNVLGEKSVTASSPQWWCLTRFKYSQSGALGESGRRCQVVDLACTPWQGNPGTGPGDGLRGRWGEAQCFRQTASRVVLGLYLFNKQNF